MTKQLKPSDYAITLIFVITMLLNGFLFGVFENESSTPLTAFESGLYGIIIVETTISVVFFMIWAMERADP